MSADSSDSLTPLEANILAFFLGGAAQDLVIAGRYFPRTEVVNNIDDKMQMAVRRFGFKVKSKTRPAAIAFVDRMIETGAWSTKAQDFGGTMHQFQPDIFRREVKVMQDADPIVQEAKDGGDTFWADRFAQLTAA
jgi:hypothetical protein